MRSGWIGRTSCHGFPTAEYGLYERTSPDPSVNHSSNRLPPCTIPEKTTEDPSPTRQWLLSPPDTKLNLQTLTAKSLSRFIAV